MEDFKDSSDEQLALELQKGNYSAFKALYFRYFKKLIQFTAYHYNEPDELEDIVQDVFFKLWQNHSKIIINTSFKAYLFQIANRLVIDRYRKKSRYKMTFTKNTDYEPVFENSNALTTMIDVENAVNQLPEKLKTPFLLSRYQGLKIKEIANVLQVSPKTVEKRLYTAIKKLQFLCKDKNKM